MGDSVREQAILQLQLTARPEEQAALRTFIQGENYYYLLMQIFLINPFFRLTDAEAAEIQNDDRMAAWWRLARPRHEAARSTAPRYVVFCMPKSGSSFVKSAIAAALALPSASLTTFGGGGKGSHFGMNSREQELDEFAIARAAALNPDGFVAQCHTRCSKYLGHQIDFFGLTPILVVRNILDCIVSFDDMMVAGRLTGTAWTYETQFALPSDYETRSRPERYEILARSYGVWLIAFYLSWKRCRRERFVDPLMLRYDADIVQPGRLVERVSAALSLSDDQRDRLQQYATNPDPEQARMNVGVSGRGAALAPDSVVRFLRDYAGFFRGEFDDAEIAELIG